MRPKILFEDDSILVVDKPAGMYVHASPGHEDGALADLLAEERPAMLNVGGSGRPGVVHRLDADTSGVMVFAKTQAAYLDLRRQFESHELVGKIYLAVLHGAPKPVQGTLDTLMARKAWDARRMAVVEQDGQRAVTHWNTLAAKNGIALVEFRIDTGRTHQIRVHAAHLGHPIVGDALYGDSKRDAHLRVKPRRALLHSLSLSFRHPATGKMVEFSAPPPDDIVYAV